MIFDKIKSHLTPTEIACGVAPLEHVSLNEAADTFAEAAAREYQITDAEADAFAAADKRTWVVQKRILAAHEAGFDKGRKVPPRAPP